MRPTLKLTINVLRINMTMLTKAAVEASLLGNLFRVGRAHERE